MRAALQISLLFAITKTRAILKTPQRVKVPCTRERKSYITSQPGGSFTTREVVGPWMCPEGVPIPPPDAKGQIFGQPTVRWYQKPLTQGGIHSVLQPDTAIHSQPILTPSIVLDNGVTTPPVAAQIPLILVPPTSTLTSPEDLPEKQLQPESEDFDDSKQNDRSSISNDTISNESSSNSREEDEDSILDSSDFDDDF